MAEIMEISAEQAAEINAPVEGFDGGVWTHGGRGFVVTATHTWAMRDGNGAWVPAVAFQALEREQADPESYVMERGDFLANFTVAPAA